MLLWILLLSRATMSGYCIIMLFLEWGTFTQPCVALGLLCGLIADNVVLISVQWRRGAVDARLLAAVDVCIGLLVLVATMIVRKPSVRLEPDDGLYSYTVASLCAIGMAYRRLAGPLAASAGAASVYAGATLVRFRPVHMQSLIGHCLVYGACAAGSWFIAARFRLLASFLDATHSMCVRRERELAARAERTRLSRDLHDRVVQTLEFASRAECIADERIRDHMTADLVWLRGWLRGLHDKPATDLAAALNALVAERTAAGMRIELNIAGLEGEALTGDIAGALRGAIAELLMNVHKHAGTKHAVLRAWSAPGHVIVTVLDSGCGFTPARQTTGLGMRESVINRIAEIGGSVAVCSEPGNGTCVELRVPFPEPAGGS